MEEIKSAVARRDKAYLKKMMRNWHEMRPYVDIWTVVDKDARDRQIEHGYIGGQG